ncbi:ERMES complex Ca(2+)-binding regulatory GTPase GEM1 KNAG_0E04140 [Huiozyma naganishii CBS 8797]|uniref:Mitochondrial Rho GTPase n=1 Tax=Huiozyma naganishii (strain ATCC MYA-139 / BCRC 22969 / CBS 8797 / KCTC 17520 / NBRC 10181 / NCYC 3082 / Yp74L-3) TaxID=1071383 RepID=J7RZL5_HUIN7|nr:hypothetical protein KNAG_0E04140 [Kazachstania naganishii CBS 8797]CCK70667.1 hypothetical protein KNAG_0E04140 [Kazachstania naganishii CBS 8797]
MTRETLTVVLCGDDGVGKTSLAVTLLKDKFIPNLQDVLIPVTIPRDFSSSPYSPQNTLLIDTNNEDLTALHKSLKLADVIWLVYSDHESYERISFHWMMMFRSLGLNIPVILCKNKCDKDKKDGSLHKVRSYSHSESITSIPPPPENDTKVEDEEFIPILMEFKEIDTCIKASAKAKYNVNQAFYLCQRSITHPIAPLFDAKLGDLKPLAREALERIFLLCDNDQDNYLNDEEINFLQRKCFHKSIDINELEYIKQTLLHYSRVNHPRFSSTYGLFVPGKGITKEGFLVLNKLFAEKGRHETIWGILRAFKYTDSLSLERNVLHPKVSVPSSSSVELSPRGYRFLVDLFIKFDHDNDGGLDDDELLALFKTTPGLPQLWLETNFPYSTVVNKRGHVTLQGWLAQWTMTTFLDYRITTEYLIYFGFEPDTKTALQFTKPRKYRRRSGKLYRSQVMDRSAFNCFVIGKAFSGKTTLLDSFLSQPFTDVYTPTTKPKIAVNSLELKGGKQYYLILQEFGKMEHEVLSNKEKLQECDVLCLTYDSSDPDSFSYLIGLLNQLEYLKDLPTIIVGLKADLDKQQQRCTTQPDEFSERLYVSHPLHISSTWLGSLNELFVKITEAALVPANNTPDLPEEFRKPMTDMDYRQMAVILGSTVGFMTLLSFTVVKLLKNSRND